MKEMNHYWWKILILRTLHKPFFRVKEKIDYYNEANEELDHLKIEFEWMTVNISL